MDASACLSVRVPEVKAGNKEAGPLYFTLTICHSSVWVDEVHGSFCPAMQNWQKYDNCRVASTFSASTLRWWSFLLLGSKPSIPVASFLMIFHFSTRKNCHTMCWHLPLSYTLRFLWQCSYMSLAVRHVTMPAAVSHVMALLTEWQHPNTSHSLTVILAMPGTKEHLFNLHVTATRSLCVRQVQKWKSQFELCRAPIMD